MIAGLIALPETISVLAMTDLEWRMGQVIHENVGLSMLGAEAVAAAERLGARVLVSSRDDGVGIRHACSALRIRCQAIER